MPVEPYPSKQYATTNHSHGNPTLALTNLTGTTASASNGLTLSLSAAAPGGGVAVGAGTQTATSGTVVLSNANGITFGMSGSSAVTASHNALTTARASNDGVGLNTAITAGPVAWTVNSNGISLNAGSAAGTTSGFTGGASISGSMTHNTAGLAVSLSHPAWLTTAMPANATTISNVRVSAGTTSNLLSALTVADSNGVSFGINGSTLTATVATTYAASNHTHGNPTLALTNLTGTTASASNGLTISLSAAAPGAGGGIAAAAGTQTATSGTVAFANGNGITFGMSNSNQITASHNGLTTAAQSDHSHGNPTLALTNLSGTTASASNGFTLSLAAAAPGGAATQSYHAFPPMAVNTVTTSYAQSTSFVAPFVLSQPLSIDRIRMVYSGSVAASSTQGTTGNTSLSMSGVTSHNIVFYSRGVGASSLSLQYVTSTQQVDRQLVTISYAANSTQMSYSNRFTLGSDSFTKDYSSSAASQNFHTSNLTDLTGVKYIDLPCGISLSAGMYWIAYGRSTASATQNGSISVATRMLVSHNSQVAVSQNTLAMGMLGGATNSSVGFQPAQGSFTTGGAAGTTSSITMANVSTAASNNALYIQMMRIA